MRQSLITWMFVAALGLLGVLALPQSPARVVCGVLLVAGVVCGGIVALALAKQADERT